MLCIKMNSMRRSLKIYIQKERGKEKMRTDKGQDFEMKLLFINSNQPWAKVGFHYPGGSRRRRLRSTQPPTTNHQRLTPNSY
jgi:hypothetical protein